MQEQINIETTSTVDLLRLALILLLEDAASRNHNPPVPHEAVELIETVIARYSPSNLHVFLYGEGDSYVDFDAFFIPADTKEPVSPDNEQIRYIKWLRELTGLSLREAKFASDVRRTHYQQANMNGESTPSVSFLDFMSERYERVTANKVADTEWASTKIYNFARMDIDRNRA